MPIMTPSTDARTLNAAIDFAQTEAQRLAFAFCTPEVTATFLTDLNRAVMVLRRALTSVTPTRPELDDADTLFQEVEQAILGTFTVEQGRTAFLHTVEFLRDSLAFMTREVD